MTTPATPIERMTFGKGVAEPPAAGSSREDMSVLAQRIGASIARALVAAVEELESRRAAGVAQHGMEKLEALSKSLSEVQQRANELADTVAQQIASAGAAHERCTRLETGLEQAERERQALVAAVRQDREDVSARVATVGDRLGLHAEALRSFAEHQGRLHGVLDGVAEVVGRLQAGIAAGTLRLPDGL